MSEFIVVTSTSNTITAITQNKNIVVRDTAVRGPQGPAGTGAQGSQGAQGSPGGVGPQGPPGTGAQGSQGDAGPQGAQGDAGPQGPQGVAGAEGAQGSPGTGAQGAQGDAGAPGPQGVAGEPGPAGGPQGLQGDAGPQGPQGVAGDTGPQGPQGDAGSQGAQGDAGTTGAQGAVGQQGFAGSIGPQGIQGAAGAPGPQGVQGAQGRQGVQGAQGFQGVQGAQGRQGAQGSIGVTGQSSKYDTFSDTVITIGTGTKQFNVETNCAYTTGQTLIASYGLGNTMIGAVNTYNSITGNLVLEVSKTEGSGTYPTSWGPSTFQYITFSGNGFTVDNILGEIAWDNFVSSTLQVGDSLYANAVNSPGGLKYYGLITEIGVNSGPGFSYYYILVDNPNNIPAYSSGNITFNGTDRTWLINLSGEIGPQGAQGATGPQGFQGASGAQGSQGSQGDAGPQGSQGDAGPQGSAANLLSVNTDIIPSDNVTYNIGSQDFQWNDLWVSNNTIFIGGIALAVANGQLTFDGIPIEGGGSSNTGNIIFSNTTISAPNGTNIFMRAKGNDGIPNAKLDLNSEFAIAKLSAQEQASNQFSSGGGGYTSGTWEPYQVFGQNRSRLILTGANTFYNFVNDNAEFSNSGNLESAEWSVDDVNYYPYPYGFSWDGDTITFDFTDEEIVPPPESVVTVDNLYLRWTNQSEIYVDQDDYEELKLSGVGIGVKLESTSTINLEANDAVNIESINNTNLVSINGDIRIETDSYGSTKQWTFAKNGSLTFPDNTVQNTAYTGGGAGLPLANGTSNVNIALANGYVTVTANVFTWTFDDINGSIDLPGNVTNFEACSAINFVANSSGDGAGYSTIELRPDSNAVNDQYLIIDPTVSNHIHIRAGGTQDNSNAQIFLGGEYSNFSVGSGLNPSVYVTANQRSWSFNNDGTITFPDSTTQNTAYTVGAASTIYFLEAYASETYTLPGSFTEDACRYSVVSSNVNISNSWFNTSTYTFTPQKAGYWQITASYDVFRNAEASMVIKKNDSIVASAGSFNAVAQQITKIIYLNGSTDYIQVFNYGGAALSRSQYAERSWFQARWTGE